ncbi:MAG: GyrI-like domain-containing protein [Nitrososphaerales archaeon]
MDFEIKRTPGYNVASMRYVGPYKDNILRKEFELIASWARKSKLGTGKWFFYELDGPNKPASKRRWDACIEIRGKARPGDKIRLKKIRAATVACVKFDPDQVSARLVYHGLESWLKWRRKYGEYKESGATREVYSGNPWTSKSAWASTEIQIPVRKL